jgi:hypothetical protein
MSTAEPDFDAARAQVAERGLTPAATGALTDIVRRLPLDALTPVKQLLKRLFSDQPWTAADDDALAAIIGAGSGTQRLALDDDLTLLWGWESGPFVLRVVHAGHAVPSAAAPDSSAAQTDLGLTFDSDVIPEVTPSPRTIRFGTPPLHTGASRFYNSADEAREDPRALRLFDDFDAVTNVLVGPDFVAVTITHPDQWETLLGPMLRVIADEFTGVASRAADLPASPARLAGVPASGSATDATREPRRVERAWAELGALRADRPDDLERILAASTDAEPARRQVAAALLADAPDDVARAAWERLLGDPSRSVRRSVVDAAVDANRGALRPLLERALTDADAWTRWKAVHGLATLGIGPSRAAVEARASDPDFRVRLEAARALG